jgi:hypothetical protein
MVAYSFGYFRGDDAEAESIVTELLKEGRTYDLGQGWKVRADRSIANPTMMHNHVKFKRRTVAVVNRDNTPSHGTDPNQIPNWVRKEMKRMGLTEEILTESLESELTKEMIELAIELDLISHRGMPAS